MIHWSKSIPFRVPRYHSDEAPQPEGLDAFDLSTSSITEMLDKLRRSLRGQTAPHEGKPGLGFYVLKASQSELR